MPANETLSDDYIANLLVNDAKDLTLKYSAQGLQAYLPKRSTTSAPKPNTRFLKNIILETDSHNAALRAKEASESRSRLKRLYTDTEEAPKDRNGDENLGHRSKKRRVEREHDETRSGKRRQPDQELSGHRHRREPHHRAHSTHDYHDEEDETDHRRRGKRDSYRFTNHERGLFDEEISSEYIRSSHRHHHLGGRRHRHRNSSRSRTLGQGEDHHRSRHRRRQRRDDSISSSRSWSRSRSRSPRRDRKSRRHKAARHPSFSSVDRARQSPRKDIETRNRRDFMAPSSPTSTASSDPLDDLIGPAPPSRSPSPKIRRKGRGAARSLHTTIDTHFAATYDPALDVHPNSASEDDWDQALEALKDRQRWKQQGADRLRQAGFSEKDIEKWKRGGEKGERDVRWASRGEGREWDRGKSVGDDDYGRLR